MAILANRVKSNNIAADFLEASRGYIGKSLSILLILFSTFLIYSSDSSKLKDYIFSAASSVINPISASYDSISNYVISSEEYISGIFQAKSENIALKLENAKLQSIIEEASRLKAENSLLKKQLKFKDIANAKMHLSARLVSNFSGMYSKGGIISAGSNDGVADNQIIASEGKIVGKISYVTDNYSRVMFVNDAQSRIPIVTSISNEKAILAGDGHIGGKLLYVAEGHKIKVGEHILSSGDGKYYPYGIPIAKVVKVDNINIYVEPLVNLSALQFVTILSARK